MFFRLFSIKSPSIVGRFETRLEQVKTHSFLVLCYFVSALTTRAPNCHRSARDVKRPVHELLGLFSPFISIIPLTDSTRVHPVTIIHPLISTKTDKHSIYIKQELNASYLYFFYACINLHLY